MMWFFCFGLIVLMTWSLQQLLGSVSEALFPLRKKAIIDGGKSTAELVQRQLLLVLTEPSPNANRVQAALFQSLRLRSWRANLMWICFSALSLWVVFAAGFSFLRVSGLMLLSVGAVAVLCSARLPLPNKSWVQTLRAVASVLFFAGVFNFAGETSQRFASMLLNSETNGPVMMLADGTWVGVLTLFAVGLIGGFLLRIEFFFFCFALAGLASGVLSVNGAVALWMAERSGLALREMFAARNLSGSTKALLKESALVQLAGALVGCLLIGVLRDLWGPVSGLGSDGLTERLGLFIWFSLIVELPSLVALAIWGHRRGGKVPEDLFQVTYPKASWLASASPRRFVLSAALRLAEVRQGEIRRLRQDFESSDWKGVPPAIRTGSEKDLNELGQCVQAIEAHLLSRSSFLGHQLT